MISDSSTTCVTLITGSNNGSACNCKENNVTFGSLHVHVQTCTNIFSFFKSFWLTHMSFFGDTGTPVLDFWWRVLWGSKPEWALPYLLFAEANVMYIPWDPALVLHLPTSLQPACSQSCPHILLQRWGCRDLELMLSENLWVRRSTNWAKPGPTCCFFWQMKFVEDLVYDPPSLLELAGRAVKVRNIAYTPADIPANLVQYLNSAHRCVNPKCKGQFSFARTCLQGLKFSHGLVYMSDNTGDYKLKWISVMT